VYFWPLGLRLTEVSWRTFATAVLLRGFLPAAAASVVWVAVGQFISPDTWLSLAIAVGVGAVAYVATLATFCLDENDRSIVRHMVSRVRG
jgi:hypothetical protein